MIFIPWRDTAPLHFPIYFFFFVFRCCAFRQFGRVSLRYRRSGGLSLKVNLNLRSLFQPSEHRPVYIQHRATVCTLETAKRKKEEAGILPLQLETVCCARRVTSMPYCIVNKPFYQFLQCFFFLSTRYYITIPSYLTFLYVLSNSCFFYFRFYLTNVIKMKIVRI